MQQATEQQIDDWMQNGNPEWGGMLPVSLEISFCPDGRHLAIFTLEKTVYGDWKYRDMRIRERREYQITK